MINKPNFIIVGAPKCGSTSLYSYLDKHPDVFMSPIKEPGFLIKEYYQNISPKSPNYTKQFDYLVLEKDKYFSLFSNLDKHYHAFGEASVTYMFSPDLAIKNILKYIGKNVSIIGYVIQHVVMMICVKNIVLFVYFEIVIYFNHS